jgi:hypothetical protein
MGRNLGNRTTSNDPSAAPRFLMEIPPVVETTPRRTDALQVAADEPF